MTKKLSNTSSQMIMINFPTRSVALQPFQASDIHGPTDCVTISEEESEHYEVKNHLYAGNVAIVEIQPLVRTEATPIRRQKVESNG